MKMKTLNTLLAVAGLVLPLAPAAQAETVITAPAGGYPASYRIMFITSTTTQVGVKAGEELTDLTDYTDIETYNTFVSAEATGDSVVNALGATWTAVGSTFTVDARDNTSTAGTGGVNDVPIYDVNGNLLALNNAALWTAPALRVVLDRNGLETTHFRVWTGSLADGTAPVGGGDWGALGDTARDYATHGDPKAADQSGTGRWIKGNTQTRSQLWPMYALSSAISEPSTSFPLTITPNGANYDFEWDSQDGKLYDLVSDTDLSMPRAEWPVYMGHADIEGSAPSNTLENVPGDGTERFFAVLEKDPPPVTAFEENFDGTDPGWTSGFNAGDTLMNTAWALGPPTVVGPPTANSGANCYGTNLAADYGLSSDIWLRTPSTPGIDLTTATGATLTFQHWVDIDPFETADTGTVRVLKASDLSFLETLAVDITGLSPTGWVEFSANFTAASLGNSVVLEFVFVSDIDDDAGFQMSSGWYIDDVVVTVP